MNICIVTTAFPRWENDSRAPFIIEVAKSLEKQGLQIKIIASHSPGSSRKEMINNIEVLRPQYLPERWENLHREPGGIPEAWKTQKIGRLAIFPFILSQVFAVLFKTKECDLFHANWTIAGTSTFINSLLRNKPYIITIQGSDIYKAAKLPLIGSVTRLILSNANRIITLSTSLKNEVLKFNIPAEKISIIPNGVDTQFFTPVNTKRQQIIFFAGSLIKRKGVEYLIKSMPKIIQKNETIKLVIAGEGNEKANLQKLVSNLKLDKNIDFLGQISQNEIKNWMQISKLFVLPSLEEGQGVVLIEALACGTPCVGSNVGGIPDVITEDVGSLIQPDDTISLSNSILSYFESEALWEIKSKRARERAIHEFDWEMIAKKIIVEYKNILYR